MSLSSGTRLGPYEILSPLGAGGMGEVYRARDTKLNRDVAIKVLPEFFANDPERLARFDREANVLASLNHQHIAQIYGVEDSTSVRALVMELVEGRTLADRIADGPLPLTEALTIARQIAEALEAAHEQGIIHRDLKPANVRLRHDGVVKVLDFGLAKAMAPAHTRSAPELSMSPTITGQAALTGVGVLLGTAAYMAPEQAAGGVADKRSDLWAFGVVLMEMLTGRPAFSGETVSHVLASVLKSEPDWTTLPADTPPPIRRLLKRCLEKDRKKRLDSAATARLDIEEALTPAAGVSADRAVQTNRRPAVVTWAMWLFLAVLALMAIALLSGVTGILLSRWSQASSSGRGQAFSSNRPVHLEFNLPPGVELYGGNTQAIAISPDGTKVAFIGVLAGTRQLYVRSLDQSEATALRGTENSNGCFFSPDGNVLGVLTSGSRLLKVSLGDGLVEPLASDADFFAGAVWGPDGQIVFGRGGTLWRIAAAGGTPTPLTKLDNEGTELRHIWPTVTEDGAVLLFTVVAGDRTATRVEALTLATGRRQIVVSPGSFPLQTSSGHLIFFRDGALLAAAFDRERLQLAGTAARVLTPGVTINAINGGPMAAIAQTGTLVSALNGQTSRIVRVSREGLEQTVIEAPGQYENPRVSPDGHQIVVTLGGDVWVRDIARATVERLEDQTGGNFPTWTPDGKRMIYRTQMGLRSIEVNGNGRPETIPGTTANDYPGSISPDGSTLAFTRIAPETSGDVYTVRLTGEPQFTAIVNGPAYEGGAQFSPDGRWLAYVSDQSGEFQVYLRPYPGPDQRSIISTPRGRQPRWSRRGNEVFYRDGNKMMAVAVSLRPNLALSPPRQLWEQRYAFGVGVTTPNYDVGLDDGFVMVKSESASGRLNIVLNWFEELKALVPPSK